MVPKIKERWVNVGLAFITTIGAVTLAFMFDSSEGKAIRVNQELKEKASIEYVDQQDAALEKDLDDYRDYHVITHKNELDALQLQMDVHHEALDDKLEFIVDWIKEEQ